MQKEASGRFYVVKCKKTPQTPAHFQLYDYLWPIIVFMHNRMKNIGFVWALLAVFLSQATFAQVRIEQTFEKGWKFTMEVHPRGPKRVQ